MILDNLPASGLIRQGLDDLMHQRESIASCLVKIASSRMRRCGVVVDVAEAEALAADHLLYDLLGRAHGREAHGRYNALMRELVSFERALEARHRRKRSEA